MKRKKKRKKKRNKLNKMRKLSKKLTQKKLYNKIKLFLILSNIKNLSYKVNKRKKPNIFLMQILRQICQFMNYQRAINKICKNFQIIFLIQLFQI